MDAPPVQSWIANARRLVAGLWQHLSDAFTFRPSAALDAHLGELDDAQVRLFQLLGQHGERLAKLEAQAGPLEAPDPPEHPDDIDPDEQPNTELLRDEPDLRHGEKPLTGAKIQ